MNNSLSLENLFRNAFLRTKERFLSYFLVVLIGIGFGFAVMIGFLLAVGLLALIFTLSKSIVLLFIMSSIITLTSLTLIYYFGAWIHLTTTFVIIAPEKVTTGEAFAKVKPLVWGYVKLEILLSLFFIGLILPSIFTLFIALIIWAFWSAFVTFVYLEQQKKGLDNLWTSKAMVSQKFWGITGRFSLVMILTLILQGIFNSGGKNSIGPFFSFLISLFTSPFVLSYFYEVYKNLSVPKDSKKPTIWLILSAIGWLFILLSFAGLMAFLPQFITNFSKMNLNLPPNFPKEFPFPFLTPSPKPNFYQDLPGTI